VVSLRCCIAWSNYCEIVTHFHREKEGMWTFPKEHKYVDIWGVTSAVMSGSTAHLAVRDSAMTGFLIMLGMPFVIKFHHGQEPMILARTT
jgi:hypothetical protein